jgi:antitoxin component YwqK of YwqJK toxin-antitoxin module
MIEVYKKASNNNNFLVIVVLEFLPDTIAISYGKFAGRGNKFIVKDIYDIKGNKYSYAVSRYISEEEDDIPKLKYIKNQIVIDKNFNNNLIKRLSGGIHFSNSIEETISSEYGNILHFQNEWNDFIPLPDGTYYIYSDVIKNTWKHHIIGKYSIKSNKFDGEAIFYHYPCNRIKSKVILDMGKFISQEKYLIKNNEYRLYYIKNNKEFKIIKDDGKISTYQNFITNEFSFYKNNKKITQFLNKNNKIIRQINYYENNNIEIDSNFDDNELYNGITKIYFENGNPYCIYSFNHGEFIKGIVYYPSGNIEINAEKIESNNIFNKIYNNNIDNNIDENIKILDCYVKLYYENGNIKNEFKYINGIKYNVNEKNIKVE